MTPTDPILITIICSTQLEAENLAQITVGRKLAASAHWHHIHSVYRWNDEVVEPEQGEWTVTLTTVALHYDEILLLLPIWHSYIVPAVTVTQIHEASLPSYLEWVEVTTSREPSEETHSHD